MHEYRAQALLKFTHLGVEQTLSFRSVRDARQVSFKVGKRVESFTVFATAKDFPLFRFGGVSVLQAPIIFSASEHENPQTTSCHLLILNGRGEVQFHRRLPIHCTDFKPHAVDGKTLYSYQEVVYGVPDLGFFGKRVILDEQLRPIRQLDRDVAHHEFLYLAENHWVEIAVRLGRLPSGMSYFDKRVRELKDGVVVFDWGVADFLQQFSTQAAAQITLCDYRNEVVAEVLHLNSLQLVGTDGILIGLGSNGVAYVNRKRRQVEWVLGGINDQFGLTYDQHPHFHHTPQFDPATGTLVLLSNLSFRSIGKRHQTRVLRYQLDVPNKKLRKFEVLREQGELASMLGSVQASGETLSIGFGTRKRGKYDFLEMHKGVETAWLKFTNERLMTYRIYRRPD